MYVPPLRAHKVSRRAWFFALKKRELSGLSATVQHFASLHVCSRSTLLKINLAVLMVNTLEALGAPAECVLTARRQR